MQVRIDCPACGGVHVFDMPEGVIYMTCARTGLSVKVKLTGTGDPKATLEEQEAGSEAEEE